MTFTITFEKDQFELLSAIVDEYAVLVNNGEFEDDPKKEDAFWSLLENLK